LSRPFDEAVACSYCQFVDALSTETIQLGNLPAQGNLKMEAAKTKTRRRDFAGFHFGQIGIFKQLESNWSYKKDTDGKLTIKNWEYCVGIDYLHPDANQIAQSCYLIVLDDDLPRYVGSYKDTWWDRQEVYRSKTGLNYFSHDQAYNVRDAIKAGHVATLWVVIDPVVALPNGIQLNCSRSIEQIVTLRLAANGFPLWNAKKDQTPLKPGKKFSELFD